MPPEPTEMLLIRHGQTAWNAEGRFLGRSDLPLDELGLAQAVAGAARLQRSFDALYCSTLKRAHQTAACFGDPIAVPGLEELDQGELEGLQPPEAVSRFPAFFAAWAADPSDVPAPGATETLRDLQKRSLEALVRLDEAHRGGVVVVVSHQLVIASLRCHAAGLPLSRWRSQRLDNVGVASLFICDGRVVRSGR